MNVPPQFPPAEASLEVSSFIRRVEKAMRSPNLVLKLDNPRDRELWFNAWSALAVGAEVQKGSSLLRMLMRLPASSAVMPSTEHVVRALVKIGGHAALHSGHAALLDVVELVGDVLEFRLLRLDENSDGNYESYAGLIEDLQSQVHDGVLKAIRNTALAERASRLLSKILRLLDRYRGKMQRQQGFGDEDLEENASAAWTGFQAPTVGWLQRGKWLDAPQLSRQYQNIEAYAETVRKMMTMLTFYWGAGALFPKCRHRGQDDRQCDQPLCARVSAQRKRACGRKLIDGRSCTESAQWRCSRGGHDCICDRCIRSFQAGLVSEPGKRASTDVYDAVVERETIRRVGVVYTVSGCRSRRPPSVEPNWKTTYRLNCSALVAVIRLGASCEPLRSRSEIQWAEVVPVNPKDGASTDFTERAKGRLALRLLTKADLSTLNGNGEGLQAGSRIAIIDLQVFVPEVASVLSILTDPSFLHHLRDISFSNRLTGISAGEQVPSKNTDVQSALQSALDDTDLELITRLPATKKSALLKDLVALAHNAKLSGTQLEAFVSALTNSLHCTQGPPGTGKSYLGVVLIRALDRIRWHAEQAGVSVGPIVVLSYKNHALDEILVDIMQSRGKTGGIIRCGKPEDSRLLANIERYSAEEKSAQEVLTVRVACLRMARRAVRDLRALQSAFAMETSDALHSWQPSGKGFGGGPQVVTEWVLRTLRLWIGLEQLDREASAEHAYALLEVLVEPSKGATFHGRDLLTSVMDLGKGVEHWSDNGICRVSFLIKRWLTGAVPPPRCAADREDGCVMASNAEGAYCSELHDCKHPSGCVHRRVEGFVLCEGHRCKNVQEICQLPRLTASEVCQQHACVICMRFGYRPIQPRIGAACREHSCREQDCTEVSSGLSLPFCSRHCCLICRKLARNDVTKVGAVRRVQSSSFCEVHKCVVERCVHQRVGGDSQQLYCKQHACIACVGVRRQVDPVLQESRLCVEHRCAHDDHEGMLCGMQKDSDSQFCEEHTCRFCRAEGLPLDWQVVAQSPRNVCSQHPLCVSISFDGRQCNERVRSVRSAYCGRHAGRGDRKEQQAGGNGIKMQCQGITKKGKRCKTTGVSTDETYYCGPHFDQRPESSSDDDEADLDEGNVQNDSGSEEDVSEGPDEEERDDFFLRDDRTAQDREGSSDGEDSPSESQPIAKIEVPNLKQDTPTFNGIVNVQDAKSVDRDARAHDVSLESADDILEDGTEEEYPEEQPTAVAALDLLNDDEGDGQRIAFNANQDEVDVEYDESSSSAEEVPEQLQHLRDIIGEDSSGSDSDGEGEITSIPVGNGPSENRSSNGDPASWAWEQTLPDRWKRVADFIGHLNVRILELAAIADRHVESARCERAEAAAYSFKRARVIGATVVGATRRLHALRASEPFAMVVEEACEVMEPTLLSVLAVRSLLKLELIGDHRQLPAFVQPCWFFLQTTHPSIRVSLFERLVDTDSSTCTVLDVQRRMRPEICELTRCEYQDLVQIQDHECTTLQRIGDKYISSQQPSFSQNSSSTGFLKDRALWNGEGSEVPGIKPHVYFWDMETKESRAAVGLSRCNHGEAKACAGLVFWVLQCGVPPSCISIITPFKGQKMTIIKQLRKLPDPRAKLAIVSTVDRYQGDENDIVILSLVSTRPGNRFVALRNRFIVSTSRARIGFYIIGSSAAISRTGLGNDGPSHWRRFLCDLKYSSKADDGDDRQESQTNLTSRFGRRLTICCPRHDGISKDILSGDDLPNTSDDVVAFCSEPCSFVLPWCGHTCQLKCHSLKLQPHTGKCDIALERPCEEHVDVPLFCHQLDFMKKSGSPSLQAALDDFRCDVPVQYRPPECSHSMELPCHLHKEILSGACEAPECMETVEDFFHPICGHRRQAPTCRSRRQWEELPPKCLEIVIHERACGCRARMTCHESIEESSLQVPPNCLEAVSKPRPRCSHPLSSRCYEATILRQLWSEQGGESASPSLPHVVHGRIYGPAESSLSSMHPELSSKKFPKCLVRTSYRRECGHTISARCAEAFELAAGKREERLCREDSTFTSPLCGHEVRSTCNMKSICASLPSSLFFDRIDPRHGTTEKIAYETALRESPPPDPRIKKLRNACKRTVAVIRKCGHKSRELECKALLSLLETEQFPRCEVPVNISRSCGHSYEVPCSDQGGPPPDCHESVDRFFSYPACPHGHSVPAETCFKLERLLAMTNPMCPVRLQCVRARCGHTVEVPCHQERNVTLAQPGLQVRANAEMAVVEEGADYCEAALGVAECHEPVLFQRLCGHVDPDIPCHLAFEWAAGPEAAPPCKKLIEVVSPLCQHTLRIDCCNRKDLLATNPWEIQPPPRITIAFDGDDLSCPVVDEDKQNPLRPAANVFPLLQCRHTTRLQRSCGHELDVPCHAIFDAIESPCECFVSVACEDCGHERSVQCHDRFTRRDSLLCENLVEKTCSVCHINVAAVQCHKKMVCCESLVTEDLPCGHPISWICGDDDPRERLDEEPCLFCLRENWKNAHARAISLRNQITSVAEPSSKKTDQTNLPGKGAGGAATVNAPSLDMAALLSNLKTRARAALPPSSVKGCLEIELCSAERLVQAYLDILTCHIDLFSQALANDSREGIFCREPPQLSDSVDSYDIVYSVASEKVSPEQCFKCVDTQYGYGAHVSALSTESLVEQCAHRTGGGAITIYVGAALRHQALQGVDPFRLDKETIKNKYKKKKALRTAFERAAKKARKVMMQYIAAGFDHAYRNQGRMDERVYWIPGSIFPLLKLDVQLYRTCGICLDDTVLPARGWYCPRDHFLCRECFNMHVEQARTPGALKRTVDGDGNVLCPHEGCDSKFETLSLLSQKHDATEQELKQLFGSLQELKTVFVARREVLSALEQQKTQLQAEFQRIQMIEDLDERRAETVRLEIVEKILTLRCPKPGCGKAFLDFDGCFALSCSLCSIQFCAWCVDHYGVEIHHHVATCDKASKRGYFHSRDTFEEHHRGRRKRLIVEKLKEEAVGVRERILARLSVDFRDLGIMIGDADLS